jgi:AcrR family transcriptional regulator
MKDAELTRSRGRAPGRPRDLTVEAKVRAAVVAELSEVGVSGFSVNSVSARSGVAKRTIASRWADREALITDGLSSLSARLTPPRTGRLDTDLISLAEEIIKFAAEPRRAILARCAAELEIYPQYYARFRRDSFDRCMAAVEDVLVDARGRGELRADVDLGVTADCFVSAILGSRSFGNLDATAANRVSDQLISIFLRGLGPLGTREDNGY